MLPVVAGLAIVRNVFSKPGIVKFMTRTDRGAIIQTIDAFEKAARQEGIRLIGGAVTEGGNIIQGITGDAVAEAQNFVNTSDVAQNIKGVAGEVVNTASDAANQMQIDMPDVQSFAPSQGFDPARVDYNDRLTGLKP